MIVVLYCFVNLALNLGVLTLIDTRNWRQWYYSLRTVNETFDHSDVTARCGSHLVTSSIVRRLQCVLLSVIYSLSIINYELWHYTWATWVTITSLTDYAIVADELWHYKWVMITSTTHYIIITCHSYYDHRKELILENAPSDNGLRTIVMQEGKPSTYGSWGWMHKTICGTLANSCCRNWTYGTLAQIMQCTEQSPLRFAILKVP